jgi:hypothetical protein
MQNVTIGIAINFPQRETVAFRVFGQFATLCRPDSYNKKRRLKWSQDWTVEKHKKVASTVF